MIPQVPPANAPGGDGARVAAELSVEPAEMTDSSANMNQYAPDVSALLTAAPHQLGGAIQRHPDP